MPRCLTFLLLLALPGVAAAQDTNFAVGPQYLITTGSPLFLSPIATPSRSLDPGLPPVPNAGTEPESAPVSSSAAAPSETFLGSVYWGDHTASEITGRRLVTPSMTPSETMGYMNAVAAAVANAASPASQTAVGAPPQPSVIEFTFAEPRATLSAAAVELGVTGKADAQSLRGYGASLGDAAAYWKAHKGHATHTYTNSDVERLHGG
jgi:hypothetical protein